MGRKSVVIYTDDFTGEQITEDQANEVTLRLGTDEWTMVLTHDSEKKLREALEPFTGSAEYKNRGPRGRVPDAPTAGGTVVQVAESNAVLRSWWRSLKPADLRQYGLNAPKGDQGRVPNAVRDAYAAAHPSAPVAGIPVIFAPAQ